MCRVDFWRAGSADAHLHDGDDGNEDGRRAQAVLVEVPAPVCLAGQDLVGHVADKALVQAQPRLVQEDLPLQRAPAIGDGPSEAAGALAAHLRGRKEGGGIQVSFQGSGEQTYSTTSCNENEVIFSLCTGQHLLVTARRLQSSIFCPAVWSFHTE